MIPLFIIFTLIPWKVVTISKVRNMNRPEYANNKNLVKYIDENSRWHLIASWSSWFATCVIVLMFADGYGKEVSMYLILWGMLVFMVGLTIILFVYKQSVIPKNKKARNNQEFFPFVMEKFRGTKKSPSTAGVIAIWGIVADLWLAFARAFPDLEKLFTT